MRVEFHSFRWAISFGISWNISDRMLAFHFLIWTLLIDYSGQK